MEFNSTVFLFIVLPLIILLYFVIQDRYRKQSLIFFSLFFYAYYDVSGAVHFAIFVLITYIASILLVKTNYSKLVLGCSITALVFYLMYYKYLNFLLHNLQRFFGFSFPEITTAPLPLGVSFYVFSAIAFFVDIYREKERVSLLEYSNYVTFFPKLISGPIVSIRQFNYSPVTLSNLSEGISRFVIGLSKKTVLSYYFGLTVDTVWNNLSYGIDTPSAWIGAISYSFQLYFDFSGYSDMAIGLAKIFGYDLGENFNFPYISRSISEFWRRWHISLGNWFREYLYFPLGGSRRGNAYINLLIVFVVTGVWHGANWTFILWGLWHGILRVTEKIVEKTSLPYKIPGVLKWLSTMLAVVLGWVVFRSSSIKEATDFIQVMFGIKRFAPDSIIFSWKYFLNNRLIFLGIIGFFGATFFKKSGLFDWWSSLDNTSNVGYFAIQTIVIVGLAGLSIMMVLTSRHMPFLYFQF